MKNFRPYEIHEDRRQYPRIVINCPADIYYQGKILKAIVYDISPDGLQIRCSRKTLQAIHPNGAYIKENNAPSMDVTFQLSTGKWQSDIKTSCRMYYFVLLPEKVAEDVAFGLKFIEFREDSAKYVDDFITDALTPMKTEILGFLGEPHSNTEIVEHTGLKLHDVRRTLFNLMEEGEIISIGSGINRKHIRLNSVISTLLEKSGEMEKRLSMLERNIKNVIKELRHT
jgi:hypothetical protein